MNKITTIYNQNSKDLLEANDFLIQERKMNSLVFHTRYFFDNEMLNKTKKR